MDRSLNLDYHAFVTYIRKLMTKYARLLIINIAFALTLVQPAVSSFKEHKDRETVPIKKQFMQAAQSGDKEKLQKLYAGDTSLLNYQDSLEEWSALHHVVYNQQ